MTETFSSSKNMAGRFPSQGHLQESGRCRICLEQDGILESLPCDCKNELGLVHQACFAKWVQVIHPNVKQQTIEIACQICKRAIKMEVTSKTRIKNCKQINQNHKVCEIASAFIALGVIVFLLYLCVKGIIGVGNGFFILYIVLAIVIILLLIVLKVVVQITIIIFKKVQIVSLKFLPAKTP